MTETPLRLASTQRRNVTEIMDPIQECAGPQNIRNQSLYAPGLLLHPSHFSDHLASFLYGCRQLSPCDGGHGLQQLLDFIIIGRERPLLLASFKFRNTGKELINQ